MSVRSTFSLIKSCLTCLMLASVTAVAFQGYMLLYEAREVVNRGGMQLSANLAQLNGAIASWERYAQTCSRQVNDPQVQRGFGLLLRSGDDLARTIKRANVVLESLNDAIRTTSHNFNERITPAVLVAVDRTSDQINMETIPEINKTIRAATEATESLRESSAAAASDLSESLVAVRASIESIERRVNDPRFDLIIRNVESATAHADETLLHVERKTKDLTRPIHWFWRGIRSGVVIVGRIIIP